MNARVSARRGSRSSRPSGSRSRPEPRLPWESRPGPRSNSTSGSHSSLRWKPSPSPRPGARLLACSIILLLLSAGAAYGQNVTLRGEAGLDTGVSVLLAGGEARVLVPVVVRARLEFEADLGTQARFRSVLLPAFGAGTGGEDPLTSLGLQEAFFLLRYQDSDLSAGLERLPLSQMRLVEPVSIEPRLETGEPRGPLAVRARHYTGPWRVSGALLAVTGDDLLPEGPGGVASLRHESPAATVEGHALWTVRPALGVTASGSIGSLVAYGEGWLLADPWEGRGGLGTSGYLGEWLVTVEAAWSAPGGNLLLPARPTVAVSTTRPLGASSALDATVAASWPRSTSGSGRYTQLDAALSLRQDQENASLTVTPALHLAADLLAASLGISLRGYY